VSSGRALQPSTSLLKHCLCAARRIDTLHSKQSKRLLEQAIEQAEPGEMPKGGPRSTSFRPGQSGNPNGRPKRPDTIETHKIIADVKMLARECAPQAISTLKAIMLSERAPAAARISAASSILDRAHGKPKQEMEIRRPDLSRLTDDELDALEALLEKAEVGEQPATH
jgi:hypothetical protein